VLILAAQIQIDFYAISLSPFGSFRLKCILFICAIRIQKSELLLLLEDKRGKIRVEIICRANDLRIVEQPSIIF